TRNHPQFQNNPLVTGPPYIRFYAGAPLITADGHALGSLCVIDYQPRQISPSQQQALRVLSRQVVAQIELNYKGQALKEANEHLEHRVQERTASLTSSLHRLLKAQAAAIKKERASYLSNLHDPLTGLTNRNYFLQRLDQAMRLNHRQPSHQYAVLLIDLDNFRPINESMGAEIGDRLLTYIAKQITLSLRKSDLVSRLAGDEFAILLDDIRSTDQAIIVVQRLQKQLEIPFEIGHHKISVGASIGITFSDLGYRQPESALKDAAVAMRQAKKQNQQRLQKQLQAQKKQHNSPKTSPILIQDEVTIGTQQYVVFDAGTQHHSHTRLTIEDELRRAVIEGQFHLHYQPIFNLHNRQISGFEALLRWQHPTRGCLEAKDFIDIAEEIGITRQLCSQIIHMACEQYSQWNARSLTLHINLSLMQMRYPQLLLQWKTALESHQISAASFQIEIAEKALLSDDATIISTLQQLKAIGLKLCIDDFGRGHSSLSRLHQLGVDTLKINRDFIRQLNHENGFDIIKTIIDFGRSANIQVVANGIETAEQMQTLIFLGCQTGQGFWLAKPLAVEDIKL
ncbi:MAG: EAL domain-containing protein, partial [Cyanobacteria bacterium J06632_3]